MKRLIISIVIIGVIIAVGVFALNTVAAKNDRLYGHIESVLSAYNAGEDAMDRIRDLTDYFEKDYAPRLSYFVDDELLADVAVSIYRLEPMYETECDEFTAECEAVRVSARRIYQNEVPSLFRIL